MGMLLTCPFCVFDVQPLLQPAQLAQSVLLSLNYKDDNREAFLLSCLSEKSDNVI